MLSTQALCSLLSLCLGLLAQALCALLSLCIKMPGPHLLKYVVPLYKTDHKSKFLIYVRDWYLFQAIGTIRAPPKAEAMWSMWEVTAKGDEWWRPKTWQWAGSKHLCGPNEESVTDYWPHLSENVSPDTIALYTFNSWADVGGSDTWVRRLSDEGPVWWTYHCSEPKEGIFWKKAKWSGGQAMDWEKMHKTKSPKAKAKLVLRLRGQAKAEAKV